MAKTKGKKAPARKGGAVKAPAEKTAKPKEIAPKAEKPVERKISQAELDALPRPVEAAKGDLDKAQAEAMALAEEGRAVVAEAKAAYQTVLVPYREACGKAGVACEYEGDRCARPASLRHQRFRSPLSRPLRYLSRSSHMALT